MSYVFSGKLEVPKGQNPNFNFNFGPYTKNDEAAEIAADVILDMELGHYAVVEAVLKDENHEVKKYFRIEKKNNVLV
jgi:hypothetical protein